ncbi:hypothetical protein M501DRAFT_925131 [Patellaria atrata CBS 101060]|uniref:C2H2-type domain-containing protein n=1 Tax=Patellaria atrata CBS 101060 TaxID=1346257 RepID=A0A9P4VXB4_9PEZI|nr:hypothetical protein M501DRAFT_925131 [Patellaria atrata CBS 101060]
MSTSRTGGKTIVKKERRKGRVGKKSKGRPTKILKSFIGESEVAVDIDPNLWILPDGSWGPQDGPTAKQGCRFVGPNGPCGKMFKRAEHLKRHYKTHSGTKSFRCPICENCFGRNDNKNQHYKTHIKPTRTPRNDRWEHEIMFKKLRNDAKENNESLEEVEKVIQSLKNFIANGFV